MLNKTIRIHSLRGRQNRWGAALLFTLIFWTAWGLAPVLMAQQISNTKGPKDKPTQQTPMDQKQLEEIRSQIETTTRRAHELENQAQAVSEEITGLAHSLVKAAGEIQDTENLVSDQENRLKTLDQQQQNLEHSLLRRNKQMSRTLAAMQRLSQQPAELIAFRPEKSINTLRGSSLLNILLPELKSRARLIATDIEQLEQLRHDIEVERAELKGLLSDLNTEQVTLNKLMAERRQKQQSLIASTAKERQKLKQFAAKAKNLQDLIARIEEEARRKAKAARQAALRLQNKPDNKASNVATLGSRPFSGQSFASAKGQMPLPVRGLIDRPFGRNTSEGLTTKGITIATRPLATVIAPFEGRVVFAGKFRTYGQLLIIAHGQEYHTLLAGMTRIDAIVGQWVLKGEPVGQMAALNNTPQGDLESAGQKLYVELRRRGRPINPLPWIVARDRKVHG